MAASLLAVNSLLPSQSIFTEIQSIHDTGFFHEQQQQWSPQTVRNREMIMFCCMYDLLRFSKLNCNIHDLRIGLCTVTLGLGGICKNYYAINRRFVHCITIFPSFIVELSVVYFPKLGVLIEAWMLSHALVLNRLPTEIVKLTSVNFLVFIPCRAQMLTLQIWRPTSVPYLTFLPTSSMMQLLSWRECMELAHQWMIRSKVQLFLM